MIQIDPEEARNWSYCKSRYSSMSSALDCCPRSVAKCESLRVALVQIQMAEALIDKLMTAAAAALNDDD